MLHIPAGKRSEKRVWQDSNLPHGVQWHMEPRFVYRAKQPLLVLVHFTGHNRSTHEGWADVCRRWSFLEMHPSPRELPDSPCSGSLSHKTGQIFWFRVHPDLWHLQHSL